MSNQPTRSFFCRRGAPSHNDVAASAGRRRRRATANGLCGWIVALALAALTLSGCRSSAGHLSTSLLASCAAAEPVERLLAGDYARVAVVGDVGEDARTMNTQTMAALATALDTETGAGPLDAILILGDNFYHCGLERDDQWEIFRPLAALGVPLFPVWGNHDYGLPGGCPPVDPCRQLQSEVPEWLRPLWRFPAPSYRVELGDLAVISMLDTTPLAMGWTPASDLQQRLSDDLATASAAWKVAGGHHVLYSSGRHGIRRERISRMRELRPTLRTLGVDVFFAGHDHHLELIRRPGDPLWVISGSGSLVRSLVIPTSGSLLRAKKRGYALLELTTDTLTVTLHELNGRRLGEPVILRKHDGSR